jgi:hypothetical protein
MNYITIVICLFVLPIVAFKEMKPKLCINCKHFITDNKNGKFGKCSLFPIEEENNYFLINGIIEDNIIDHDYCSIARNDYKMCGHEGKLHIRKYNKNKKLKKITK